MNTQVTSFLAPAKGVVHNAVTHWNRAILVLQMTIQTKSMMRRRVNRAGPSGLVWPFA